jgi:hypothetical protein
MYDPTDPRSALMTGPPAPAGPTLSQRCAAPQYFEFSTLEPDEVMPAGTTSWYVRGQNFALVYSSARAGEVLRRAGQTDEHVLLLPSPESAVTITTAEGTTRVEGRAVVLVPPGDSEVVVEADSELVRLFSCEAADLLARCRNRDAYDEPHVNVAAFRPWPDPVDGYRLRVYPLSELPVDPARFGRILRSTTFMINYFYPEIGPRDPAKLSPHTHDDFEQISLQLEGDYVHHIRTPWTADLADWRDDDHRYTRSPAVTIIPPPAVHTSQSVGHMRHQLVDLFCPPRHDFSARPGWVLNADTYPTP